MDGPSLAPGKTQAKKLGGGTTWHAGSFSTCPYQSSQHSEKWHRELVLLPLASAWGREPPCCEPPLPPCPKLAGWGLGGQAGSMQWVGLPLLSLRGC